MGPRQHTHPLPAPLPPRPRPLPSSTRYPPPPPPPPPPAGSLVVRVSDISDWVRTPDHTWQVGGMGG